MSTDPSARRRLVVAVLVGILIAAAVAAFHRPRSADRIIHDDGGGPLSASSGDGGVSIYPPPRAPWTASFGTFVLCVHHRGERIRIERVRSVVAAQPLKLKHVLRVVPPEADRPPGFTWPSYISESAAFPGNHREPYGGTLRPVEGAVIDQPCSELKGAHEGYGYTDLLTELTVDGRGAKVRRTYVDYNSDGRHYTLVIRWEMTACGTVAPMAHCPKPHK